MHGFDEFSVKEGTTQRSVDGTYIFDSEPSHILRSMLKNNPMSGVIFSDFLKLLYKKRMSIDWWRYKHRIIALLCMSLINSFLSFVESAYVIYLFCFKDTRELILRAMMDNQPPLFIIGHPRTGTTLLHNLLALDTERFTFADTFMVGFPHSFLSFETIGKLLFRGILTETRPMDNMKLHFDLPQEDELGINILSGFEVSPYTSLMFMKEHEHYSKFCRFRPGEVTHDEIEKWCYWFKYFISKIKIRDLLKRSENNNNMKRPRRLLLKSPCHTGRIRLLLKLFPDAKFVFLHRNPLEVFTSSAHLANTTFGWMYLQQPSDVCLQEYTLSQGQILHDEFFDCKNEGLLNRTRKNCVEVSFAALTKDPSNTVKTIYQVLGFDSFDHDSHSQFPQALDDECARLKFYKPNNYSHVKIDEKLRNTIRMRWKRQFEELGYQ